MPDYKISALTWNMGNNQIHGSCIQQLSDQIDKEKADIILVSAQEAKESNREGETLSERLAKRQGHRLLYQTSFSVFTKVNPLPMKLGGDGVDGISNILNPAKTHLGILIKPGIEASIDHFTPPGQEKDGLNKGGQYAVLKIGDQKIGIIGAHLDSNSAEKRQKEIDSLMRAVGEKTLDTIIFMGDLNERLSPDIHRSNLRRHSNDRVSQAQLEGELIKARDPLTTGRTPLTRQYSIEFQSPGCFSYHQQSEEGTTKYKTIRGNSPDAGVLDNIGLRDTKGLIKNSVVQPKMLQVTNKDGFNPSDHRPVLRTFEIKVAPSLTPEDQLTNTMEHELNHFSLIEKNKTKIQALAEQLKQLDLKNPEQYREKIKQIYRSSSLSFEGLIRLNRLVTKQEVRHSLSKESFEAIVKTGYKNNIGKSEVWWGMTKTMADMYKLADSQQLNTTYPCDIRLILELRDERNSLLRTKESQESSISLFNQFHQQSESYTKTENTIIQIGHGMKIQDPAQP
ncbi:Phosphatidylinositol 5-phosphate phosphatase [Piscirickettsia salmonis]|uniref:Nuclease n=1 Tax=Piscirickettsia salmonis TaxID=1238 RepID=A0AAC8VIX5_PISSA|nr:hypothetical protein [Piscirickettsia salmonis]ALB23362.1 nuclease [Piscirickettsia salmonis]QGN98037.1 Phosphatidylinositol 5-phosphate phosphatase [Piscirickettsia salmonis]QGO01651.1 Phosphatidylinositol 5-phosphate phosphatase [Piscirickettsia salmonis]QGO12349.1 Phosphatidylinositol 5-phosphate phosphatase [Piscirickettsia salmonis]QGO19383.1 Phosphatidylinositol 5-phosphate phosphatase [Piscirickettsia salmonis]